MSAQTITMRQRYQHWSEQLFQCLQEMAAEQTNAVLQVLDGVETVETGRRYPDAGMGFARHWRAYYHCHPAPMQHGSEHGHFHIFTDVGDAAWAHVAGLAIDDCGQPLHWFAVNRWVTDGPWLDRVQLVRQLQQSSDDPQDSLTGRWLYAMLQLHGAELDALFETRDSKIQSYADRLEHAAVLEDRDVYTLATRSVELQAMLEQHLLH